jgi:hypothetical protein
LPQGRAFEAGLDALAHGDHALGPATLVEPAIIEPGANGGTAAPETTDAGLVRRTPKAAALPSASEGPSILAGNRSPEDVRSMLAAYRAGMEQAKAGEAPTDLDGGDPG